MFKCPTFEAAHQVAGGNALKLGIVSPRKSDRNHGTADCQVGGDETDEFGEVVTSFGSVPERGASFEAQVGETDCVRGQRRVE